jgi:hypothetical protein
MYAPPFALALALYIASGGWAAGAPVVSAVPKIALQENHAIEPARWRYRRARDYDASSRAGTIAEDSAVLARENLFGLIESLHRDSRRRRGWVDPPLPQ